MLTAHMATLQALYEWGREYMFGIGPLPPQPATFSVPAGEPVAIGANRAAGWQKSAWSLWKQVGELHYPTTRLARQSSQLEWRVRVNGRELTPDSAKREIEAATAGMGPQEATYLLSLNDQVAGESWYVQTEEDRFTVWSVVEPDLDKKIDRLRAQGRIVLRMWQPDPTNPTKADSSVRTAIGPATEVLTLQSLSESQARSRISQAGILVTPAEQLYAPGADPWEADLIESMQAAIADVSSPSALAPIHVRMRRDLIEFVRYITFPRPYDDLVDRKIERAVHRVASALDIEPELITGIGDSSYWNAWAVSMDTYQAHIAPRAERIGALYGEVIERIRDDGLTVEVEPNPRVMLARRSSVRDALDALKSGAVNFAFLRDAIGATDADAPNEEEMALIMQLFGRGGGGVSDRERRVGENPGPARSSPTDADSELEVLVHARKQLGLKLREAWRNTPKRNRTSGLMPSDYTCHIPLDDIAREFAIREVIGDAVREVALDQDVARLTSWIMETLLTPVDGLRAMEEVA